jgi:hypothetical protein
MQIEISAEERELLVQILERNLSETRVEVRHTDDRSFRDRLHGEEARLRELLGRLRALQA